MTMNRFHNHFAILNEAQINRMRPMKPQRSRKRKQCDFPKLSDVPITPVKNQLPYAKLIPSLTRAQFMAPKREYNNRSYHDKHEDYSDSTGYDSDHDILNQVWCIEKDKPVVFESDIYSDLESENSFVYESDSYE